MSPARRRTILFLICAVVLLGAGFASGYIYSYNGFYSPEAQLDHELVEMNFNTRQLFYANAGRRTDVQRELVKQLRGQVDLRQQTAPGLPRDESRANAQDQRQAGPGRTQRPAHRQPQRALNQAARRNAATAARSSAKAAPPENARRPSSTPVRKALGRPWRSPRAPVARTRRCPCARPPSTMS